MCVLARYSSSFLFSDTCKTY